MPEEWIAPTLVLEPSLDDDLMREEIFGPVLPIVSVSGVEEAIEVTNQVCDQPLALYIYSEDQSVIERYLTCCTSGGASVNSGFEHMTSQALPFGGVGTSGMGS